MKRLVFSTLVGLFLSLPSSHAARFYCGEEDEYYRLNFKFDLRDGHVLLSEGYIAHNIEPLKWVAAESPEMTTAPNWMSSSNQDLKSFFMETKTQVSDWLAFDLTFMGGDFKHADQSLLLPVTLGQQKNFHAAVYQQPEMANWMVRPLTCRIGLKN